jgi:dipeptidyl aminopeptidase/acylaminoacyl peptidase
LTNYTVISTLIADPEQILLSYDINDDRKTDVIKYNINTGSTRTIYRGNEKVSGGFLTDFDGDVRAGTGYDISASSVNLYVRAKGSDEWELIHQNKPENREVFDFLGLSVENPNEVMVSATLDRNTAGIYSYNIETKKFSERLFGLESVDTDGLILSQKLANRGELLGYSYTPKHPIRFFLSSTEAAVNEASLYQAIEDQFPGQFVRLSSRSEADNAMVIYTQSDSNPGTYYLLINKKDLSLIGDTAPLIDKSKLAKVMYVEYKARDSVVIPAYVTIPQGKGPFPIIVNPHGGPWARDVNIFDPWSQMLANNGYLVIQPQFRSSQGFGLEHWKPGDREWGKKMQDDLDDAAMWLVKKGLAGEDRLGMFGWSYGGYAAFVASLRKNNIYKCAAAGAGVGDLDRVLSSVNNSRYLRIFQAPTVQ